MKILPAAIFQLLFLSLPSRSLAQIDQFPACSVSCYNKGVALTGCSTTDFACQCGPASRTLAVQTQLSSCLLSACSSSDLFLYNAVAEKICASIAASSVIYGLTVTSIPPRSTTTVTAGSGGSTPTGVSPEDVAIVTVTAPAGVKDSGTSSEGKKNNVGLIVGVVVGVVGVLALIAAAILLCLIRRKRRVKAIAQQPVNPQANPQASPQSPPDRKSEFYSEGVSVNTSAIPQQTYGFKEGGVAPICHQTIPDPIQANEMQGEGRRHIPEIHGTEAMRPNQPSELDSNWNWVAGRPQNPTPGPGV